MEGQLSFSVLFLYAVTVVAVIATPGPVALLVAGAGLAGGAHKAFRTIIGANAASLVLILLSALVMKGVLSVNETAFNVLKLLGGCYIGSIAWTFFGRPARFQARRHQSGLRSEAS